MIKKLYRYITRSWRDEPIKPTQTEIKGDLKGYFETVDKETPITKDMSANVISVEIKRTEKELPFDRKDVTIFPEADDSEKSYVAGFGIEVLDDKDNVIAKAEANSTPYSWDEMKASLQTLPGETATIKFHFYDDLSKASISSIAYFLSRFRFFITAYRAAPRVSSTAASPMATYRALIQKPPPM